MASMSPEELKQLAAEGAAGGASVTPPASPTQETATAEPIAPI